METVHLAQVRSTKALNDPGNLSEFALGLKTDVRLVAFHQYSNRVPKKTAAFRLKLSCHLALRLNTRSRQVVQQTYCPLQFMVLW